MPCSSFWIYSGFSFTKVAISWMNQHLLLNGLNSSFVPLSISELGPLQVSLDLYTSYDRLSLLDKIRVIKCNLRKK